MCLLERAPARVWQREAGARADAPVVAPGSAAPRPRWLSETGLYQRGGTTRLHADVLAFSPQYPLWTDGADKRRWIRLPKGTSIDASNPDDFVFPVGTLLFKEFRFGRAVETRVIERAADGWRYATYVWRPDGRDAELAPPVGVPRVAEIRPGVFHDVPSADDCVTCHESRNNPVLGFTALQLSPARDALAPHGKLPPSGSVDLAELVRRGLLTGLPENLLTNPPRIVAESDAGRAVRGYFFGNCAHCHNAEGPLSSVGLDLDVSLTRGTLDTLRATAIGRPSHFRPDGSSLRLRIAANDPDMSVLVQRIASREPVLQMPPLGTRLVDDEAVRLVRNFVARDLAGPPARKEHTP